jgi:hypothetical protein
MHSNHLRHGEERPGESGRHGHAASAISCAASKGAAPNQSKRAFRKIGASAMTATDLDQQLAELRSVADAYAARHHS